MSPLDVLSQVLPAPEYRLTVMANKLFIGVMSLEMKNQVPLGVEDFPTLNAQVFLVRILVNLFPVILQRPSTLETFSTYIAWKYWITRLISHVYRC